MDAVFINGHFVDKWTPFSQMDDFTQMDDVFINGQFFHLKWTLSSSSENQHLFHKLVLSPNCKSLSKYTPQTLELIPSFNTISTITTN